MANLTGEGTPDHPLTELEQHFRLVATKLLEGNVVPFLGAGVNLSDRPDGLKWSPEQNHYLPNGSELANHLAGRFDYPRTGPDLLRVSLYGQCIQGSGSLYEELDSIFRKTYPLTSVHSFLGSIPMPAPLARTPDDRFPLLATTNYDDLVERIFESPEYEKQQGSGGCDLIFYLPESERHGSFWHQAPGKKAIQIPVGSANAYSYPLFEERPVVLKIHGTISLQDDDLKGYVISEDDYIDYLADQPMESLLPSRIVRKLKKSHLWFLGYSLSDWNFRVFLRRIRRSRQTNFKCWAVKMIDPSEMNYELTYWHTQDVDVRSMNLLDYVAGVRRTIPVIPGGKPIGTADL